MPPASPSRPLNLTRLSTTTPTPKRPDLHQRIDAMSDAELAVVEHILIQLERERLWQQVTADFTADFTADWAAGQYDRLDEIIREVRQQPTRVA